MPRTAARPRPKSPYAPHPSIELMQKWVATLKEKTGRSLDEWLAYVGKAGPKDEAARRDWLKNEHKLGTNSAWWIAERSVGKGGEDDSPEAYLKAAEAWVEAMYAGKKAGLRPIYDRLLRLGLSIGKEAKACPCQTIVPIYRRHVIAQIKPTTNSRIDFGYALAAHRGKLPPRLIDTGGRAKKDRITHRIEITSVEQIDDEVKRWLKVAYDLDA